MIFKIFCSFQQIEKNFAVFFPFHDFWERSLHDEGSELNDRRVEIFWDSYSNDDLMTNVIAHYHKSFKCRSLAEVFFYVFSHSFNELKWE